MTVLEHKVCDSLRPLPPFMRKRILLLLQPVFRHCIETVAIFSLQIFARHFSLFCLLCRLNFRQSFIRLYDMGRQLEVTEARDGSRSSKECKRRNTFTTVTPLSVFLPREQLKGITCCRSLPDDIYRLLGVCMAVLHCS